MSSGKGVAAVYDAMLKTKVFKASVKVSANIPCKLAVALALAVEYAVASNDPGNLVGRILSEEERGQLLDFALGILRRGDVEDLYEIMKELGKG
jgi:hypothetical protein